MNIINCKVNHLTNPLGYTLGRPVLSWQVSEAKGTRQTAARIRIALTPSLADPILDTGFTPGIDSLGYTADLQLEPRTPIEQLAQI